MSLSRVKVWIPGDVLTASDLNSEFNNVINNPISLVSPTTGSINFNLQAHTNFVPSAISASSATDGQALIRTAGVTVWGAPTASAATVVGSRVSGLIMNSTTPGQLSSWAIGRFAILQTTASTASIFFQSTASFTIDAGTGQTATTSGGRDQASTFSNAGQWVHFYLITTGANSTTPTGICSLTAPPTGPSLPSSYSAWAYLNSMYYTTGSQFQSMIARGAKAYYYQAGSTSQQSVTSSATQAAGVGFSIPYSTAVPPATVCPEFNLAFHIEAVAVNEPYFIYLNTSNDSAYHRGIPNATIGVDLPIPMPNLTSAFKGLITTTARVVIAYVHNYTVANGDN